MAGLCPAGTGQSPVTTRPPLVTYQEGVLFPFLADGGSGTMAWNYDSLIRQGQHALVQRPHDFLERSSGEIGASNAAGEQRVAGDQQFLRGKIETDAALGVAGSVEHVCRQMSRLQRFAVSNARFDGNL